MQNIDTPNHLKECISNCNRCPLSSTIDSPTTFDGVGSVPIMLVTDSPGIEEYRNKSPFASKAGAYLADILVRVGFDPNSFLRTNMIKCHQMMFDGNTPDQALVCGDWLDAEIRLFQPKVIVVFGNMGVYRFSENYINKIYEAKKDGTPKPLKGIMDKQGLIEWNSYYKCWVMYMLHPNYIEKNQSKEQSYVDAWQQLKNLYDNNFERKVSEISYHAIYPKNGDKETFYKEAKNFLKFIGEQEEFSCDLETTGLNYLEDRILLISYSWSEGKSCTIMWDEELWSDFKASLETESKKTFQNGKFDLHFFHEVNIFPNNFDFDTMLAAHQIDENAPTGLGFLTTRYLGLDGDYKSKFWGDKTNHTIDLSTEENILKACEYANKDTDYTLRLRKVLQPKLIELGLYPKYPSDTKNYLYRDMTIPLLHILIDIERNGLSIDLDYQKVLEERLKKQGEETYKHAEDILYKHLYADQNHTLSKMIEWFKFLYSKSITLIRKYNTLDFKPTYFQSVQNYQELCSKFEKLIENLLSKNLVDEGFKQELATVIKHLYDIQIVENSTLDDVILDGFLTNKSPQKSKPKSVKSGVIYELANIKSTIKRKKVDITDLDQLLTDFHNLYENLDNLSGIKMNLGSPDQMSKILYEILGLTVHKWTDKQKPSTDKEAIALLAKEHEFPKLITEYRHIQHDISNYIDATKRALAYDNRVHPDFSQNRTVTGRLSCLNPAMHNISRGFAIRNMFIPEKGNLFVECDLSQAEVRMLAALSKDESLLAVFESGEDIHTANARKIFKLGASVKPTKEQRAQTKRIVFAIIYGSEVKSVAEDLQISVLEAQKLFDAFYDAYPKAKEWMDSMYREAKETGAVTNLFGRKRRLPDINSTNKWERREAERMSVNAPTQSSASDYMSLGHIKLQGLIKTKYKNKGVKQIFNQHDMLLVECPIDIISEVRKDVQYCLENAYKDVGVIIKADADIVNCWSGCPMSDEDVLSYKLQEKLDLLPSFGLCKHTDVDKNTVCGTMFKPFSHKVKFCPDHYVKE